MHIKCPAQQDSPSWALSNCSFALSPPLLSVCLAMGDHWERARGACQRWSNALRMTGKAKWALKPVRADSKKWPSLLSWIVKERACSHESHSATRWFGASGTGEYPDMEGKGHMMAVIEAGGRMLKEEDSIVKAEGRQPRWLSQKLVLRLVVVLVWLNFQKWGKWYPIAIAPGLWCLKSMPLRERAHYRSEHIQNRGDKGCAWVIRPPEVHQLWASTSFGRTSQTSAGQRQKAKHQQRWKEQWTETQWYVSPWINNDVTAPGRWLAAQVWGLEFNPQHPGKNSGVATSACDPNVRQRHKDGWAQRSASPPEVSVSEVSVRDSVSEKYDAGGSISSSGKSINHFS